MHGVLILLTRRSDPCPLLLIAQKNQSSVGGPSSPFFLGGFYELQPSTYNSSRPVYVQRNDNTSTTTAAAVWIYYDDVAARWEIADYFRSANVFAFVNSTADAPQDIAAVNGTTVGGWSLAVNNGSGFAVVHGISLTCTCG